MHRSVWTIVVAIVLTGPALAASDSFPITLVIHGGAGTIDRGEMSPELDAAHRKALETALLNGFEDEKKVISMVFKDASLKDILKIFSIQSGLNFVASETVKDRLITLYLDKVPIRAAMDQLFKANNLTYD